MAWKYPEEAFNALQNLPPKIEVETKKVLKRAIEANKQLAELKQGCLRLPNPEIILNTIALQESKDSSEIENIVTTQDALYKAILTHTQSSLEVKEVLRYREAMYMGIEETRETGIIRANSAIKIMQTLRGIKSGLREITGTKLANPITSKVIYTPPEPHLINGLMKEWEKFVNEDTEYDPLVRMALMHYQFEAIHPFTDGNGRTGRILNILFLMNNNLITAPVLYHSSYIIQHKSEYYTALKNVTEEDKWEEWVLFMLDAIIETAQRTMRFIDKMLSTKSEMLEMIKKEAPNVPALEMSELLFSYPYLKVGVLVERGMGTVITVTKYLKSLEKAKIISSIKLGKTNYYINYRLMDLLVNRG